MKKVQFFDVDGGRVVNIPACELASGAVLSRVDGVDGDVWLLPNKPDHAKHPPFNESVRIYIRQIQAAFVEHNPLSFDEWEYGFRCNDKPAQQIAAWWYAVDIYNDLAGVESCEHRRKDIYNCLIGCMTSTRETIWKIFQPSTISYEEAEDIVERFYGVGD